MNPIEMAKQRNEQQRSGGSAAFFALKDGESVVLRFLTGMVPSRVVSHQCGLKNVDIKEDDFETAATTGQQVLCPGCGLPLTEADVVAHRPGVWAADVHNYFPTSDANKRSNFTCLASHTNAMYGYIPTNQDGTPMYQCPACTCQHNYNKKSGKYKQPSLAVYGIAVERQLVEETEIINGVPTPVVKDSRDVMVEEDGKVKPKLLIVNKGYQSFWSQLGNWSPDYSRSICNYDWRITRHGEGLETSYDIQCLNASNPTTVDISEYKEFMPDVEAIIKGMGDPSFYHKKGYAVPGYQPPDEAAQTTAGTAQESMHQAVQQMQAGQGIPTMQQQAVPAQVQQMQAAQPVQQAIPTAPQTGAGNDWSVVSGQFN